MTEQLIKTFQVLQLDLKDGIDGWGRSLDIKMYIREDYDPYYIHVCRILVEELRAMQRLASTCKVLSVDFAALKRWLMLYILEWPATSVRRGLSIAHVLQVGDIVRVSIGLDHLVPGSRFVGEVVGTTAKKRYITFRDVGKDEVRRVLVSRIYRLSAVDRRLHSRLQL